MSIFEGKTAAIVGGGTGMGKAIAESFSAQGGRVIVGGRRMSVLEEVQGDHVLRHSIDVADRSSVNTFFDWAHSELGGHLDLLVIAAGINIKTRSMATMTPEQWDQVVAVNTTGAYNCMHAVLPKMRELKSGTIINISSVAGKRAIALGGVAYSSSKFAMTALGTCVANEVAPEGVRITNLYPGEVNTPILDNRPTPVTEEHKQKILQPEDVASLVLSIASLPANVHVPEVVIKPLSQEWY